MRRSWSRWVRAHANRALAAKGEAPVQVVLGADALDAHAAVIDYESRSLFLRP